MAEYTPYKKDLIARNEAIIKARYIDYQKYDEIASAYGVSKATVSILCTDIDKIKEVLETAQIEAIGLTPLSIHVLKDIMQYGKKDSERMAAAVHVLKMAGIYQTDTPQGINISILNSIYNDNRSIDMQGHELMSEFFQWRHGAQENQPGNGDNADNEDARKD